LHPSLALQAHVRWLDLIYTHFDGLVEAYGGHVSKIEVVSNTYVVTTGLLSEHAHHSVIMACFAADLHDLCRDIPGVGHVKVGSTES
jgi:hypothetical protein